LGRHQEIRHPEIQHQEARHLEVQHQEVRHLEVQHQEARHPMVAAVRTAVTAVETIIPRRLHRLKEEVFYYLMFKTLVVILPIRGRVILLPLQIRILDLTKRVQEKKLINF